MARLPVALLLALLLVPAAQACSLSRAPAGPGYIWLHDADGTLLRTIEVEHQTLGGDCSLYNLIGMTSRHLAWHDGPRARLLDLTTLDVRLVDVPDGDQVVLTLGGFLVQDMQWDGTTSNSTWELHRWDGSVAPLALPRAWANLVWHDGQHAVVQNRSAPRDNVTSWTYDLLSGDVVSGPFNKTLVAGGADWVVFDAGNGRLRLDGARVGEAEANYHARITQEGVWKQEWNEDRSANLVWRHSWDGNDSEPFSVKGGLLAANPTHVATGVYALEWRNDPFSHIAPSPVGLLIGLLLLGLAGWRRPSA